MVAVIGASLLSLAAVTVGAGAAWRSSRQRRAAAVMRLGVAPAIDEGRFVKLGGLEQWVELRGEDRTRPVLLVIHGGPGAPCSIFAPALRAWERDFVVVQWDLRGAGKTFGRHGPRGTGPLSYARLVGDAVELVQWLRAYLEQRQLVVLSSSAGSPVGLSLALRGPDLVSALVATDLNVGVARSAEAQHLALLATARTRRDRRLVQLLERSGPDPRRWSYAEYDARQRAQDGAAPRGQGISATFVPAMLASPRHSLRDVLDLVRGLSFSGRSLWQELVRFDARALGLRFEVPLLVFQGAADLFTPAAEAEAWLAEVEAPVKVYRAMPGAGHLAAFTRPAEFLALMREHLLPLLEVKATGR
jgi:pimeloyl-ACP methyl ester carboxylesterase